MRKFQFISLLVLAVSAAAQAGLLGVLISSHSGTSLTGHLVWECTYSVAGTQQTVVLDHLCPPSMTFN